MDNDQLKTLLGGLTGLALLALLVRGVLVGQPLSDRTLAVFGSLLWVYLNVDIGFGILPTPPTPKDDSVDDSTDGGSD